jgi:hypothetical protein
VAIAEHLGARYAARDDVLVEVVHRDADRASGYSDADPSTVAGEDGAPAAGVDRDGRAPVPAAEVEGDAGTAIAAADGPEADRPTG